jgi:phospholipid/cholesterol/gamma-HCH transport system permease protein
MVRESIIHLGESGLQLGRAGRYLLQGDIDGRETLYHTYRAGVQSAPIVMVAASFIGLAMSIQIARELVLTYGAARFVGGMLAVAIVREIGPVFTAVAVAGNVGSAIAAEIASMQVTEQVDALRVFNIDPVRYLVVPRLLATALVTPFLGVMGSGLVLLVGMVVSQWMVDIPYAVFLESARSALTPRDVVIMLVKSSCFGVAIAIIGCSFGLRPQQSAESVGSSTTRAVVWGLLSIFFINYLITSIFFEVGLG